VPREVTLEPEAKWVVFTLGDGPDKGLYYNAHSCEQMSYHLTMLAFDMSWIAGIEFCRPTTPRSAGGRAATNEDHELFGYRQSDLSFRFTSHHRGALAPC